MNNTKTEILALLKRNGGHSVKELAGATSLAPGTIRQHLTQLQRDGLVGAEERAEPNGRAHYLFRLSAKGHAAAFPGRSDRLVELLVREMSALDGADLEGRTAQQKIDLILQRFAYRLADEYTSLLQEWPLQERVVFVTEVMHTDGGFAEWERTEQGYRIRDFNCLFHRLFDTESRVCEWHRSFLSRTLGAEVRVRPCSDGTAQCCQYEVMPPAGVGVTSPAGSLS